MIKSIRMIGISALVAGLGLLVTPIARAQDSVFVSTTGNVGIGTSTPAEKLHVNSGRIRIGDHTIGERSDNVQDLQGNSLRNTILNIDSDNNSTNASFSVSRDGNVNAVVFVAREDGFVGVGMSNPTRPLHVTAAGAPDNTVLELQNNSSARIRINNSANGEIWNIGHQVPTGTGFVISDVGDAVSEMFLDTAGNVTFTGTVTPGSSRTIKEQFSPVDSRDVLRRVVDLPITTWSYKAAPGVRHVGPLSEDFFTAFAVGADDKGISVTDSAGVALAAIQGLYLELAARDAEIAALRARLEELAGRLEQQGTTPQ